MVGTWKGMDPRVRLVSITEGADFEIDLSGFEGPAPAFACVADTGGGVRVLHGLEVAGRITIPDRPDVMWLRGERDCALMRATPEGVRDRRASFRCLSVGEFCVEIYYVRPDGSAELVHQNDFCFK